MLFWPGADWQLCTDKVQEKNRWCTVLFVIPEGMVFFFFSPTAFVHILWEGGCKVSESSFLHEFLKHELLKVKIPLAIRIDTWGFKSALN